MKTFHVRAFLFFAALVTCAQISAQTYTSISLFAGRETIVFAINNSGMSTGGSGISPRFARLWSANGSNQDLGNLGAQHADGYAINNLGHVAGYSVLADKVTTHAFLWTSATGMQDLGGLGRNSIAYAINDNDEVAGDLRDANTSHAFRWTPTGGMQDLGTLGGPASRGFGINAAGHIVGTVTPAGETSGRAFLWTAQDGMKLIDLGQNTTSYATAINDLDQVVGSYINPQDNQYHAFLWSASTGKKDLGVLRGAGSYSSATAINNNGDVVGVCVTLRSGKYRAFAVIWRQGGAPQKLGLLVVPKNGLQGATGINASGQIVANSPGKAVRLTPQ